MALTVSSPSNAITIPIFIIKFISILPFTLGYFYFFIFCIQVYEKILHTAVKPKYTIYMHFKNSSTITLKVNFTKTFQCKKKRICSLLPNWLKLI